MESPFQQLLEFFFANIWIVIIVGGFILNTFRRFNNGESEPTTQIPFPKQFKPFDQDKNSPANTYREAEVQTHDASTSTDSNTFYERYLELQGKNAYADFEEEIEGNELTVTKPVQLESKVTKPQTKMIKNFSKNRVIEGIIWTEILGPPKAKRPYQRKSS